MKLHLPLSLLACVLLSLVASPYAIADDDNSSTTKTYTGNGLNNIDIGALSAYTLLKFQMSEGGINSDGVDARNYFIAGEKVYAGAVEIVGGTDANGNTTGLILNDGSADTVAVFEGAVTGSGRLKKTGAGDGMNILFTGDVTGYTGNIYLGATATFHLSFGGMRGSDNSYQGTDLTAALSGSDKGVSGTGSITFASSNNHLTYRYNKGTGTVTDEAGVESSVDYDTAYVLNEISTSGSGTTSKLYVAGTANMVFSKSVSISSLNIVDDALASSSGGGAYVTLTSGSIGAFSGVAKGLIKTGTGNLAIFGLGHNTLDVQAGTVSTNSSSTVTNGTVNINGGGFSSLYLGAGANLVFRQANSVNGSTLTLNSGSVATLEVADALNGGSLAFNGGTLKYGEGVTTDVSGSISGTSMKVDINGNEVTWSEGALTGTSLVVQDSSVSGGGMLTLSAMNYTGTLSIESGEVILGNASLSGLSIANGTTLSLSDNALLDLSRLYAQDDAAVSNSGTWVFGEGSKLSFGEVKNGSNTYEVGNLVVADASSDTGYTTISSDNITTYLDNIGARTTATYADGTIILNRTIYDLTWSGSANGIWSAEDADSWTDTGYTYLYGDHVTFAANNNTLETVTISGQVAPGSIEIAGAYKFVGADDASGLSGSATMTVANGGVLSLASNNSGWSGTATVETGGVLELASANALGSATLTFDGGTLRYGDGVATDVSGIVFATSGSSMNVDLNGQAVLWESKLTLADGTLVLKDNSTAGNGQLTLGYSGEKSNVGSLTIESGTVLLGYTKMLNYSGSAVQTNLTLKGGAFKVYGTAGRSGLYGTSATRWAHMFNTTIRFDTTVGEAELGVYDESNLDNEPGLGLKNTTAVRVAASSLHTATISADITSWGYDGTDASASSAFRTFEVNNGAAEVDLLLSGTIGESNNSKTEGKYVTMVKTGTGAMKISGTNNTPGLTIQEGTLIASGGNALGMDRGFKNTVTVGSTNTPTGSTATLRLDESDAATILQGNSQGIITSTTEGVVLTVGTGSTSSSVYASSFDGKVTGTIGLAVANYASLTLNNSENTYTGATTLGTNSTLILGSGATLGSSSLTSGGGSVIQYAAESTITTDISGNLTSGTHTVDVNGNSVAWNKDIDFSTAETALTLNVSSTAAGGNLTLGGSNSFASGSSFVLGTNASLTLGSASALGSTLGNASLSFNGGTLKYASGVTTDVSGIVSATSGNSMKVDINGNAVTWSAGALSGASLVVSDGTTTSTTTDGVTTVTNGTGVLTLGENTTSGPTTLTINSGTVKLMDGCSLATSGNRITTAITMTGGKLLLTDDGGTEGLYSNSGNFTGYAYHFSSLSFAPTAGSNIEVAVEEGVTDRGLALTSGSTSDGSGIIVYNGTQGGGTVTISANILAMGTNGSSNADRTISISDSVNTDVEVNITGNISNSGWTDGQHATLQKTGTGTLKISGENYFPKLTVVEGTVIAANVKALSAKTTSSATTQTVTVGTDATSKSAKLQLNANNTAVILQGSSKGEITSSERAVLTVGDGGSTARSSSFAGSITGNVGLSLAANTTFAFSGSNTSEGDTEIAKSATLTVGDVLGITSSSGNNGSVTMSGVSYGKLSSDDARYDSVSSYFSEEGNIWHLSGSDETFTLSGADVTLNGDGSVLLSNISFTGSSLVLGSHRLALENVSFDATSGISADGGTASLYGSGNIVLSADDFVNETMLLGDGDGEQVQSSATTTLTVSRFTGLNVMEGAALTLDVSGILDTDALNEGATIYLAGVSANSGSVISVTGYDGAVVTRNDGNGIYITTGDAVPEPATATLSLLALAALAARRRRR